MTGDLNSNLALLAEINGKKQIDNFAHEQNLLIAERLDDGKTCYYTCHCTGQWVYSVMKEKLKDHLEYLSTGKEIEIS